MNHFAVEVAATKNTLYPHSYFAFSWDGSGGPFKFQKRNVKFIEYAPGCSCEEDVSK